METFLVYVGPKHEVEIFFSRPLRKSFRLKQDTFYVTLLLSRGNDQACDRWQNSAEQREQESA